MPHLRNSACRVAVVSIDAVGHVNPMLAVGAAIARHPGCGAIKAFGPKHVASAFQRIGLNFEAFGDEHELDRANDLALKTFIRPLTDIKAVIARINEFAPDIVLYDCFSIYGWIAARECRVPGIALVSLAGYGAFGDNFIKIHSARRPDVEQANKKYIELFGFDFLAHQYLPVFFPSECSIVTTVKSLAIQIDPARQPLLHQRFSRFEDGASYVGPCSGLERMSASEMRGSRIGSPGSRPEATGSVEESFPYELLKDAKQKSKYIVVLSLGTVITYSRFDIPVGGAPSGSAFLQHAINIVLKAVEGDPRFFLVLATGLRLGLDGNSFPLPANAIARQILPQRELLQTYADVFVTHHGANSQTESLEAGVPMISLPGVGDQIVNARLMARRGAAVSFWDLEDPFRTCNASLMRQAIECAIYEPGYRRACAALRDELRQANGPSEAANFVLDRAVNSRTYVPDS